MMTEPDNCAKIRGQPITELPKDLYIPPEALEIFLEAFEGPLDLLLYLIKKQNLDILDIPQIAYVFLRLLDNFGGVCFVPGTNLYFLSNKIDYFDTILSPHKRARELFFYF